MGQAGERTLPQGPAAAGRDRANAGRAVDRHAGASASLLALAPALALWLQARWGGSFAGAAAFGPRLLGLAALAALAWLGARSWRDPLRLSPAGAEPGGARSSAAWLPVAVAAVSLAQSPVGRAGYALVGILPWLLLVPAAVARAWRDEKARRLGLAGVAAVLVLVAGEALVRQVVEGYERAAMPLGHHNLLALWLLLVMPLTVPLLAGRQLGSGAVRQRGGAVGEVAASARDGRGRPLPLREGRGEGGFGLAQVIVAWLALLLGVAALFATGSLAGAIGLAVEVAAAVALLGARSGRKVRRILVAAVPALLLAIALWQGPRLADVVAGGDPSARARVAYWTAGLSGFAARPLLGWGPGASSWLVHEHLRPVPGVQPAYEVVSDLHSVPIEVLFETGVTGGLAGAAVLLLFVNARRREIPAASAQHRVIVLASLVGMAGALAAASVSGAFDLPALGFAVALAAGAALPRLAEGPAEGPAESAEGQSPVPGIRAWPLWAIAAGSVLLLAPDLRGQWHYERALLYLSTSDGAPAKASDSSLAAASLELDAARRSDPRFPLYPLRMALLSAPRGRQLESLIAASAARGLGALWLRAGAPLGEGTIPESPQWWQLRALERACDLEPFGGLAPFLLAQLLAHPPPHGPGTGRFSWSSVGEDPSLVLRSSRAAPVSAEDRVTPLLARAFAAEPRLAAAAELDPADARQALRFLERVEAWPIGWRAAAVERLSGRLRAGANAERVSSPLSGAPDSAERPSGAGEASPQLVDLALALDADGSTSLSLFAFRRKPSPAVLLSVPLRAEDAAAIDLPPLWSLIDVPAPRWRSGCGWLED